MPSSTLRTFGAEPVKKVTLYPAKVAALHKLHGFLGWAEVSAKDDHMLRETVTFLVDAMVSKCGLSKGLVLN